jgi:hypothetical protein
MSQEKALKGIQKNDCFIPRKSTGSAGASTRIERPSGQLTESAQMPMTQIGEGVSLFGNRGDQENLSMKRLGRMWTEKSRAGASEVGLSILGLRVLRSLR